MSSQIVAELQVGDVKYLDSMAGQWEDLSSKTVSYDPYSQPQWLRAYLGSQFPSPTVAVLTCKRKDSLCAILPLVAEKKTLGPVPVRKLRVPTSMLGASTEIPHDPMNEDEEVRASWDALKNYPGWDILELPSVPEHSLFERLCEIAQTDGFSISRKSLPPMAYIRLRQPSGEPRDMSDVPRSSTLRSRLRKAERTLSTFGRLRLRRFEEADASALQRFFDLEASGWKGRTGSAILANPTRYRFFTEVAKRSEQLKCLSLYFLELDDHLLAAHFGILYRSQYFAPKIAYDEKYSEYRPGHLLVQRILRDCLERGITEYSMGMSQEWKLQWTDDLRNRTLIRIFNKTLWAQSLFIAKRFLPSRSAA